MSDEFNIVGQGRDILLPAQGNPFKKDSPADEPKDLGPAEVAARFGKARVGPAPEAERGAEPVDLSPEDIAALFPASQDERNAVPTEAQLAPGTPPPVLPPIAPEPASQPFVPSSKTSYVTRRADPIELGAFDPDAVIGRPRRLGKAVIGAPEAVDLNTFYPDLPMGEAETEAGQTEPPASDASAIKADAPPPEPTPWIETTPVAVESVPATSALPPTEPLTQFALPTPPLATPPLAAQPFAPEPVSPTQPVGFRPFDPFAPPAETGLVLAATPAAMPAASEAVAATVISSPAATSMAEAVSAAMASSPASPATNEAMTTAVISSPASATSPGSTAIVTAVSRSPTVYEDDEPGGDSHTALPTVPPLALPVKEDWVIIDMLVTDARVDELWKRIEQAEKAAVIDSNSLPKQRTANLENLQAARNLLLGGRQNYEDVLRYLTEVEADLFYAGQVRHWSYSYGVAVLVYNLIWIVLLVVAFGLTGRLTSILVTNGVDESNAFAIWVTVLSGGLGGVSKSLFALHKHVTQQDFDRQHLMWYFTSPILGAVLGIFVYMFVQRIIVGGGAVAGLPSAELPEAVSKAGFVFYLLAWVVGFQQNLVLELVERVKKVLLPEKKEEDPNTK